MAISKSLRKMLPHTVGYRQRTAIDKHAQGTTLGSQVNYAARVTQRLRMVRNVDNRLVQSETQVFVGADIPGIKLTDQIILPAEFAPVSPPIINFRRISTRKGMHHVEIYL